MFLGKCVANEPLVGMPKEEQYFDYAVHERPGRIIIYFSGGSGHQYFIWEDGFVAWKEDKAENKFFTTKLEPKQIKEMIQKIKSNYEQGAKRLGGARFPFPCVLAPGYYGSSLHFQISDEEYLQRDCWTATIFNYYEKHGIDSIDTEDINGAFHFLRASSHYWSLVKEWKETLSDEEVLVIIARVKEDFNHLLFCKKLVFSLLPSDRNSLEVMELRMKSEERKIALRYGAKISEYRFIYTNKKADNDIPISLPSRIFRMFSTPKADTNP